MAKSEARDIISVALAWLSGDYIYARRLCGSCIINCFFSKNLYLPSNIANQFERNSGSNSLHLLDRFQRKDRRSQQKKRQNVRDSKHPDFSTNLLSFQNLNVYVVGEVGHPKAKIVRIVHISDTRGTHDVYASNIPRGDILIHSGDFACLPPSRGFRIPAWCRRIGNNFSVIRKNTKPLTDWREQVKQIDRFFSTQPHGFKIFIPGCWDDWYVNTKSDIPTPNKIQSLLKSAIYLEDSWCRVLGLTIYGTSWTAADDLRSEDGVHSTHYWNKLFRWKYSHSKDIESIDQLSESAHLNTTNPGQSSVQNSSTDLHGTTINSHSFVLPDIRDVAAQWEKIPTNTDILVTHMPAWRQELFVHITQRVRPVLHLCGHDFTGYGVMWKRETLFSNAALQLTSTFPSTNSWSRITERSANCLPTTQSDPYNEPIQSPEQFVDPILYTPKPNGPPRPPRWQRRLPSVLRRLFYNGGCESSVNCATLCCHSAQPKPTVTIAETRSSRAATEQACADANFIYDPEMRAGIGAMALVDSLCGSGGNGGATAGYSGGSTGFTGSTLCSSLCRRNPIVIDVYVVSDDPTSVILPPYTSCSPQTSSSTSHENQS